MNSAHTPHRSTKQPVDPNRVRHMPAQFAPIDRRLVYDGHTRRMTHQQLVLYVFLQCVGDAAGLSYYSDERICQDLRLNLAELRDARQELILGQFVLYRRPIYQVLDLPRPAAGHSAVGPASARAPSTQRNGAGEAVPISAILHGLSAKGFSA